MLQKVAAPSEKGAGQGEASNSESISFKQMKQPHKKKDFFCYSWMEHYR